MSKTEAQTMNVRLPVEIAEDLMKLRNEKNLSTIGSALKFWVDQQINEKREGELAEIKKRLDNLNDWIYLWGAAIIRAHWKVNLLVQKVDGEMRIVDSKTGEVKPFSELLKAIDKIPEEEVWGPVISKKEEPKKKYLT